MARMLPDTSIVFDATSELLLFCCQEQAGADRERFLAARPPPAPYPVDASNAARHATGGALSAASPDAAPPLAPAVAPEETRTGTSLESMATAAAFEAFRQQNDELRQQVASLGASLEKVENSRRWRGVAYWERG